MPKGPKGEKRPKDPVAAAVMVAKIATGQVEEDVPRRRIKVRMGRPEGRKKEST